MVSGPLVIIVLSSIVLEDILLVARFASDLREHMLQTCGNSCRRGRFSPVKAVICVHGLGKLGTIVVMTSRDSRTVIPERRVANLFPPNLSVWSSNKIFTALFINSIMYLVQSNGQSCKYWTAWNWQNMIGCTLTSQHSAHQCSASSCPGPSSRSYLIFRNVDNLADLRGSRYRSNNCTRAMLVFPIICSQLSCGCLW
jgi:hypothetical protein